jgi:NAD(P)-dependent dehydrogenase (short-subunit alcohol dehydrogenase family)
VDAVEAELGPVDILVNNAMSSPYKFFADFTDDEIRFAQEVNVFAPWQLTDACSPACASAAVGGF